MNDVRISPVMRGITAIEVGVLLVAGGGLYFFPELMAAHWPWGLTPFNTRLLGAIYLASMLSALALVVHPYESVGRVVTPMIATFTLVVLVASVAYLPRFTGPGYALLLWFGLYLSIPMNALFHMGLYRNHVNGSDGSSPLLTHLLHMQWLVLGGSGLALLVQPASASGFWPWPLDPFHARLYSVAFLTPAVGAWLLRHTQTTYPFIVLGVTQIAGGLLPITGTLAVDQTVHRIDWSQAWIWIGLFSYIFLSGVVLTLTSLRPPLQSNKQMHVQRR